MVQPMLTNSLGLWLMYSRLQLSLAFTFHRDFPIFAGGRALLFLQKCNDTIPKPFTLAPSNFHCFTIFESGFVEWLLYHLPLVFDNTLYRL